jgi:hypothetical protein
MLTLEFEDTYRILLGRFSGIHVPEEIGVLDQSVTEAIAWGGSIHGLLLDYTSVQGVAVSRSFIALRARLPPLAQTYRRVFVVPSPELHELAQAYARQQREFSTEAPHVVASMADAYKLLQLERPIFRPIS